MRCLAALLLLLSTACPPPPERKPDPPRPADAAARADEAQRDVTGRFLAAVDRGAFDEVHALLSDALRARYEPKRLKSDFEQEPLAKERLNRIRTALALDFKVEGDVATLLLGGSLTFKLVRERGQWHVAQLE